MTAYDEARVAGLAALHADQDWHKSDGGGVWRANYGRAVDLVLEAALPHLTDDGAAAPGGAPGNASAFGLSTGATPTAAPSSPHLEDWTEEERGFVEIALSAADSGNAGHWPTVATYLAAEVRRLRASEGATPAIDREALRRLAEGWTDLDTPGLAQPANQDWASGVDQGYSNAAAELLALIEGAS